MVCFNHAIRLVFESSTAALADSCSYTCTSWHSQIAHLQMPVTFGWLCMSIAKTLSTFTVKFTRLPQVQSMTCPTFPADSCCFRYFLWQGYFGNTATFNCMSSGLLVGLRLNQNISNCSGGRPVPCQALIKYVLPICSDAQTQQNMANYLSIVPASITIVLQCARFQSELLSNFFSPSLGRKLFCAEGCIESGTKPTWTM